MGVENCYTPYTTGKRLFLCGSAVCIEVILEFEFLTDLIAAES